MSISRREFLKLGGAVTASSLIGILSLSNCKKLKSKLKNAGAQFGVCPLCSMGCGIVIFFNDKEVIHIQGNPEHPVNKGTLCQKGQSLAQLLNNKKRLKKIKYRAAYSDKWVEITWSQAIEKMAHSIKKTRDETFVEKIDNVPANRTEGIASIAGDHLTNEEAYLFSKFSRLLGITAVAHEGAILTSRVSQALQNVFGLDAMTNPFTDIDNTNLAVIIGFDPAVSAGVLFKHLLAAAGNKAKILTIDPKITRTAAASSNYFKIIPGTDLVFFNGVINYILQNEKYNKEYILENTDISYIISSKYKFNQSENLFSGFDKKSGSYNDKTSWNFIRDGRGNPRRDDDLLHKNSVFQIIKEYFSKYSIEFVTSQTGCSVDQFLEVTGIIAETGANSRSAIIIYGGGLIKQPASGQIIQALSIIQLLLGNIGVAGGGLFSGKNTGNQQGVSDHIGEWNDLPGKLHLPVNTKLRKDKSLKEYIQNNIVLSNDPLSINQWNRYAKFITSLLKAWFLEDPKKKDKYNFKFLPVAKEKYNFDKFLTDLQKNKKIKGLLLPGSDLINIGVHKEKLKQTLSQLDWVMVTDIWENETAAFWQANKLTAARIKTEVFLLPALSPLEKRGSFTSADRNVQFNNGIKSRYSEARSELRVFNDLFKKIRSSYTKGSGIAAGILHQANWQYSEENICNEINKEISGINADKKQVVSSDKLKSDGSTLCGNWLYCGMVAEEENLALRRNGSYSRSGASLFSKWGWNWPENVKILYNRASINRKGEVRNIDKWVIKQKDNIFIGDQVHGKDKSLNIHPFLFKYDGIASIFCNESDLGPLPVWDQKGVSSGLNRKINILMKVFNRYKIIYPYLAIISDLKESRLRNNIKWLGELNHVNYCEISSLLAREKNIKSGAVIIVKSIFGKIKLPVFINEGIGSYSIENNNHEYIYIYGEEALKIVPGNLIFLNQIPVRIEKGVRW